MLLRRKRRSSTSMRALTSWACTSSGTGSWAQQTVRLYLSVTSRAGGGEGQGANRLPWGLEPVAVRALEAVEPDFERMDKLPPPRGGLEDLLLPRRFYLASGLDLVAPQTPQGDGEAAAKALSPGMASPKGEVRLFYPDTVAIVRYRYGGATIT